LISAPHGTHASPRGVGTPLSHLHAHMHTLHIDEFNRVKMFTLHRASSSPRPPPFLKPNTPCSVQHTQEVARQSLDRAIVEKVNRLLLVFRPSFPNRTEFSQVGCMSLPASMSTRDDVERMLIEPADDPLSVLTSPRSTSLTKTSVDFCGVLIEQTVAWPGADEHAHRHCCIHCVHRKPRRHHSSTHPLTLSCTYTTTRWDATHAIAFTACTTSLAVSPTNSPINPLKAATWADFLKCTSESSYCQGREMPAINIMDAWHFSDRRANAPPLLPEEYGYSYSC
jgi:hypothetical protein